MAFQVGSTVVIHLLAGLIPLFSSADPKGVIAIVNVFIVLEALIVFLGISSILEKIYGQVGWGLTNVIAC